MMVIGGSFVSSSAVVPSPSCGGTIVAICDSPGSVMFVEVPAVSDVLSVSCGISSVDICDSPGSIIFAEMPIITDVPSVSCRACARMKSGEPAFWWRPHGWRESVHNNGGGLQTSIPAAFMLGAR